MAGEVRLGARAARATEAARARVGGGDEHEARREDHDLLAADDRHVTVLERLAERFEARARELAELVQEQHAAVSQRRLARLRRVGAADEAGGRDRVVGRAERTLGDQARAPAEPGDRLDARDLDRLVGAERRQDRRQAPGDHRLAGARRALQEQVVSAGGGDLEPEDEPVVAADVREVGDLLAHRCRHRGGDAGRRLLPTQRRDQLGERLDADDLDVRHQRGLARPRQAAARACAARGGAWPPRRRARRGPAAPRRSGRARRRSRTTRRSPPPAGRRRRGARPRVGDRTPARPCAGRPARG